MLALLIPGVGMGAGQAAVQVEVPDVVGETQAAGTLELETALFDVAVATDYSDSVAVGLIISQSPEGGEFANEGSTVTIVVSLGPEPEPPVDETPAGGHYWPNKPPKKPKDHRPEIDEKRLRERQELREQIERAAGLIDDAIEQAAEDEQPQVARQATALNVELGKLREYADVLSDAPDRELAAMQERVDAMIARSADALIDEITAALTDLIQEIAEDSKT